MKKFYRSRTNQVVAGVAGGVADYFGIDPLLVRVIFVALLFSGGFIFGYIAAWILIPEAPVESAS